MQHFNDAGLPPLLVQALDQMGFTTPTPIQSEAIPLALEGKDILGSAQTGTGKTGAFGIPLVAKLMNEENSCALVLTPTRELAAQVLETLKKMLATSNIKTALLIGGDSMQKQFLQLKYKPRVIVGTPGRINDHLQRGSLSLRNTNFLVLDETDRMLDMGFGIQLEQIAKHLKGERQTLMFSATMPHNIMQLSNRYLVEPVRIEVGGNSQPIALIQQDNAHLREGEKYARLVTELQTREGSVIVFVKTKWGADKLAQQLTNDNHEADALHGDLRQKQRDRVVSSFRKEHYRVLVATDIAARGLDIPHIAHVINYDMPQNPEDYIHRIGRTARAGAEGAALNMLTPQDGGKWRAIQRLLNPNQKPERMPHAENSERSERRPARGRSSGGFGGGFAGGERQSYGDRKPREDRGNFGGGERSFGGDRPQRDFQPRGDRPQGGEFKPRGERPSYGDRKPREDRGNFGGGERSFGGDRPQRDFQPRGDRPQGGEFKPRGERSFGGDRPQRDFQPRGDRPQGGEFKPRGERQSYGDRKPREDRGNFGGGERQSYGERKSFGDKKPFGEKKAFGERKPSGDWNAGAAKPAAKKPFSGKPFAGNGDKGGKPFISKKRFA